MKLSLLISILSILLLSPISAISQQPFDRLPQALLDIDAPSDRVIGTPGTMRIQNRECRSNPIAEVRPRIIDTAIQEWAYFGFSIQDQTVTEIPTSNNGRRRWSRLSPEESFRVADSIGGYWAATPDSGWILNRQNNSWNSRGTGTRWRDPWSAAFISWVMCESGLGEPEQFERDMAHHRYIDQAIMARDSTSSNAAYVAFDPGEQTLIPGDMLCRGSRPAYQSIEERRRHLGVGARTHCDIVVKLDKAEQRIMVIGGNVRGTVGMKILPATITAQGLLKPAPYNGRKMFAHLKLNAEPIAMDALDQSATIKAMKCNGIAAPAVLNSIKISTNSATNC